MPGGMPLAATTVNGPFLTGRQLVYPLFLVTSLFFLWGFSYGLLDVLNKHFQTVLGVTKLESTGLQVMYFGGGYLIFSPIAAEVMQRKGYKFTILMGLTLYSLGAIFFWPVAHFSTPANEKASFGGFLVCTLCIACGLATLETSANSYAVVIGDPNWASVRLQFCQSWNGVASFVGPLIASKAFFSGENANSLVNVQYVYLAVACAGAAVAVLFIFSKLPEAAQESKARRSSIVQAVEDPTLELAVGNDGKVLGSGPLYKQYNMIFGFIAQFAYVGAQVTTATFFINYATENATLTSETASQYLSYGLITFTVGRFVALGLAVFLESNFILFVYACCAIALTAYVSAGYGTPAVAILIIIFFFMAPMYPTIFTMGTANLGRHTRRGAGILVMGVSGGAVFPPIQGAIADRFGTRISYLTPMCGFIIVLAYAAHHWFTHGFPIIRQRQVLAAQIDGPVTAALGGVIETVHYDERKLSAVAVENIRRSSIGDVNGATGGVYRKKSVSD